MELKKRWLNKKNDIKNIGIKPPFPRVIKLDVCNSCNYDCVFCPQSLHSYKVGNINDGLAKKIIREAYEGGCREICLAMRGEPLINKKLENYIRYAHELGYTYVFINTNGYFLDESRSKSLLDAGLDSVKVSVNAADKYYELIHGVDAYDKVKNNVIMFDKYRKEKNSSCKLYISYVATKQTKEESKTVIKDFDFIDEIIVMSATSRGGSISEVDQLMYAGDDEYTFQYPCSQLFNTINVTAEGYMIMCCQDFDNLTVMADLNKVSVMEAWNGEAFTSFRSRYLNKDFEGTLCYNCLFHKNATVIPVNSEATVYVDDKRKKEELNDRIIQLDKIYQEDSKA